MSENQITDDELREIEQEHIASDKQADIEDQLTLSKAEDLGVFNINVNTLIFQLATLSNKDLLANFKKIFTNLHDYVPRNLVEKSHILEVGRIFKEEFVSRITRYGNTSLVEFTLLMKDLMKADKVLGDTFYTRYLLRFYSVSLREMQNRGMDKILMKKEVL